MKTLDQQCQMISDIALAIGAGKDVQYLHNVDKKWYTDKSSLLFIMQKIIGNDEEWRVKPEPKTEKRKAYWAKYGDNPNLFGLITCTLDYDAESGDTCFHSWAKPPTVEADGAMTFEVPTE